MRNFTALCNGFLYKVVDVAKVTRRPAVAAAAAMESGTVGQLMRPADVVVKKVTTSEHCSRGLAVSGDQSNAKVASHWVFDSLLRAIKWLKHVHHVFRDRTNEVLGVTLRFLLQ
ncbi:hypothetical protein J6590_018216 [Homalodisca vitripennis]|nr:hypothetical protein J6590_018216 [Homalodisca vitripennis]